MADRDIRDIRTVALLRGINVGGKRLLPMAALAGLLVGLGCSRVKTYIQSGNVVFTGPAGRPLRADTLAKALEQRFGFAVPIVLRTSQEWEGIVADNPLSPFGPDGLHVVFLESPLTDPQVLLLHSHLADEEKLVALGRVLYLHLPAGAGRSKLALACVGPKMPVTNTIRNWATVLKLRQMLSETEAYSRGAK